MPTPAARYQAVLDQLRQEEIGTPAARRWLTPPPSTEGLPSVPKAPRPGWDSKLLALVQGATGLPLTDTENYEQGGESLDRYVAGGELAAMLLGPIGIGMAKMKKLPPLTREELEVLVADTGKTPKRPREMPNRDEYTKAHKVIRYEPEGPVTETYRRERDE